MQAVLESREIRDIAMQMQMGVSGSYDNDTDRKSNRGISHLMKSPRSQESQTVEYLTKYGD